MPRFLNEKLIEPDDLKKIGHAVGGTHWQADIARAMKYSKSMMTRAVGGSRTPDEDFLARFRLAMVNRVGDIVSLFDIEGLPFAEDSKTRRAMTLLKDGVAILREQQRELVAIRQKELAEEQKELEAKAKVVPIRKKTKSKTKAKAKSKAPAKKAA